MHGPQRRYWPPHVIDYGDLRTITASLHAPIAAGATDLSFSSPHAPGGGYAGGGGAYDPSGSGVGGAAASGGGGSGGGGSGGGAGGGHGGSLPFTGLAVGAVTAVGAGLTAAGGALRRLVRRRAGS